jgi:hypothetical protein
MATSKRKKLTIVEKVEKNPSTPTIETAWKFNLPQSSLFCIMKNKQLILDEEVKCGGEAMKRKKNIKSSPYDEMEKISIEWFEAMRSASLPINGVLDHENWLKIAPDMETNFEGFVRCDDLGNIYFIIFYLKLYDEVLYRRDEKLLEDLFQF